MESLSTLLDLTLSHVFQERRCNQYGYSIFLIVLSFSKDF